MVPLHGSRAATIAQRYWLRAAILSLASRSLPAWIQRAVAAPHWQRIRPQL